ncbi:MAG: hypothetical protein R2851_13415 [Caldilineaceae bacterium]
MTPEERAQTQGARQEDPRASDATRPLNHVDTGRADLPTPEQAGRMAFGTVKTLRRAVDDGEWTTQRLVAYLVRRIEELSRAGLNAVIELNPDVMADAARCDADRARRSARPAPRHPRAAQGQRGHGRHHAHHRRRRRHGRCALRP